MGLAHDPPHCPAATGLVLMSEHSKSRAAGYRKRAREVRDIARWMSLKEAKSQLLETAEHLEILAEAEEHRENDSKPTRESEE